MPVMAPAELMDRPAGKPVAVQVMLAAPEVSVAVRLSGLMAVPAMPDWPAGAVTDTVLVMVQSKPAEALKPALSVAVRATG